MLEICQLQGKIPEEINKLKRRERGTAMEEAESSSIQVEMPSGPVVELEIDKISLSEHIRPGGGGGGGRARGRRWGRVRRERRSERRGHEEKND